MGRRAFPLPPGFTATRAAGGRNGATRWEIWRGGRPDDGSWLTDAGAAARYLGDMVRWVPEGAWDWQPSGTYSAIVAGTPLPEAVELGTAGEAAAAMTRAAEARRLASAGIDPGDLCPEPDGHCPVCGLATWDGTCRDHTAGQVAAWLAGSTP